MHKNNEHNCPHSSRSGEMGDHSENRLTGWKLGLASAVVFLLPLVGAIVGIALLREIAGGELLGALVGLISGIGLASLLAGLFKTGKK